MIANKKESHYLDYSQWTQERDIWNLYNFLKTYAKHAVEWLYYTLESAFKSPLSIFQ